MEELEYAWANFIRSGYTPIDLLKYAGLLVAGIVFIRYWVIQSHGEKTFDYIEDCKTEQEAYVKSARDAQKITGETSHNETSNGLGGKEIKVTQKDGMSFLFGFFKSDENDVNWK
jgi:hypothetical protein